ASAGGRLPLLALAALDLRSALGLFDFAPDLVVRHYQPLFPFAPRPRVVARGDERQRRDGLKGKLSDLPGGERENALNIRIGKTHQLLPVGPERKDQDRADDEKLADALAEIDERGRPEKPLRAFNRRQAFQLRLDLVGGENGTRLR